MASERESDLAVARRAFDWFAHGWATGDFEPYIAMLAPELRFWFPEGVHAGRFDGEEGREHMIAKCREHVALGERLTLHEPHHITIGDGSVLFEFECDGLLCDGPFRGCIAIAFDIEGEQVVGFREYYGFAG